MDHPGSESSTKQSTSLCSPAILCETSGAFTHAPLKYPRHFRILHLTSSLREESDDWKDQVLHGTLVETSLDDIPLYLALSYAWGDPSPSDVILIDERESKITQSCGSALRRMLKGKSEIMIWVDAICINQAGDTRAVQERNAQVALMDEIYSKAIQVNVYLSEGNEKTDEACKAVKRLATACRAALEAKRTGVEEETTRRKYDKVAKKVLKSSPEFLYGKLYPLFRLPWFRRLWVFQEVVLARKVVYYCGEHTFSLQDLIHAADFRLVPFSKLDPTARHWGTYIVCHNWALYHLWQQEQGEDTNAEYGDLLRIAARLDATRPEDKIYGMYGCARRLGLDWPTPDYANSVAQIYTAATVACFRQDKDLTVMNMAIGPAVGELGLPSWVPEFSGSYEPTSLSKPPKLAIQLSADKRCSGASQYEWNFILDGRHLKLKGRRFDYIAVVGEPWQAVSLVRQSEDTSIHDAGVRNNETFIDCIGSWFEIVLQRNKIRESSTNLADELVAISDLADLFTNAEPTILEPRDRIIKGISVITLSGVSDDYRTIKGFMNGISPYIWKLVLRTANKLCMGISNYNAEAGDLLVVFHGMKSPCVIRPCAGGFNFIGSAFVEGILNGEFWEGGSNEDDEWFTLI